VRDNFVLIAVVILLTNLSMALFRSPTVAYLGDLFKAEDRSKANGVINLMGGLGGAAALFGGGALYKIGVPLPFIVGAGVMLIAIVIVLIAVKEPEREVAVIVEDEQRPGVLDNFREVARNSDKSGLFLLGAIFAWFVGWNAMEAFFTLYGINVLGLDAGDGSKMLTAFAAMLILFAIPSGLIATKIGRKRTITIGLLGMVVGLIAGFFIRSQTVLLIVLAVMGGFWALVNINSLPMVYDLGGEERIGAFTGLYYFASSAAAITGPIVSGTLIDLTGKNYAILWLFSAVFIALAAGLMQRVRPHRAV
jgi:MFS family permease